MSFVGGYIPSDTILIQNELILSECDIIIKNVWTQISARLMRNIWDSLYWYKKQ